MTDLPRAAQRKVFVRALVLVAALFLALAAPAAADVGLNLTLLRVRTGGWIYATSNASGMPVYLVPSSLAPAPYHRCHGNGVCPPISRRPPGPPFVLLGRVPGKIGAYARHSVRFRVPHLAAGSYRVFLYCRPCGGSMLVSGATLRGQTLRVR